jgi:hypothetical protein
LYFNLYLIPYPEPMNCLPKPYFICCLFLVICLTQLGCKKKTEITAVKENLILAGTATINATSYLVTLRNNDVLEKIQSVKPFKFYGAHLAENKEIIYFGLENVEVLDRAVAYVGGERKVLSIISGFNLQAFEQEFIYSQLSDGNGNLFLYCASQRFPADNSRNHIYKITPKGEVTVKTFNYVCNALLDTEIGLQVMSDLVVANGVISGKIIKEDLTTVNFSGQIGNANNYSVMEYFYHNGKFKLLVRVSNNTGFVGYELVLIDAKTNQITTQKIEITDNDYVFPKSLIVGNNLIIVANTTTNEQPFTLTIDLNATQPILPAVKTILNKGTKKYNAIRTIVQRKGKVYILGLQSTNKDFTPCYWEDGKLVQFDFKGSQGEAYNLFVY